MKVASDLLSEKKPVAIGESPETENFSSLQELKRYADNTNADPEIRAVWVELAKKLKVPIRCVHFTAPAKLCEHNDTVRALSRTSFNPENRAILPHSAFSSFSARFKQPKASEGFQDIVTAEFQVRDSPLYIEVTNRRSSETC